MWIQIGPIELDHFGISPVRHDDEVRNNRRCRPFKGADVLGIRYCYPLVHTNGFNLCAARTIGINLSTRVRIVWCRGKANISRLLGNMPLETSITRVSTYPLPYEIVEMIITHIAHDPNTLRAFSLTCHSWYIAAVPHLHYTLTLTDHDGLKPLSKLHRLGLISLMKEIRVEQYHQAWLVPQVFSRRNLRYFSAFTNVQTLVFESLDISRFMPDIERYFAHFSPTLRSIMLLKPLCTPQQLSHFLSLFSTLDNITIWQFFTYSPDTIIPDVELLSFSTPTLRGRLVLRDSDSVETWTCLIALGGDLQFYYMDLWRVGGCAPVLFEACAGTLETLRFYAADTLIGE